MKDKILIINPGSTSTKIAIFKDKEKLAEKSLSHSAEELAQFKKLNEQLNYRKGMITEFLEEENIDLAEFKAIAARGGLLDSIPGGTYEVNSAMLAKLNDPTTRQHACNLAALIANEYTKEYDIPAFIVDPVVVDEMIDIARISGHKNFARISTFHALNQKARAREVAEELGKNYEDCNFVVVHMGGGITIGSHIKGKVVDVNDGLDGEGPFTPERTGTLPMGQFADYIYNNDFTRKEVQAQLVGQGGIVSYLGTNDLRQVVERVENNDKDAVLVFNAMAYQIAKYIAYFSVIAKGKLDAIVLTGGMAYSELLMKEIENYVSWIAPVYVKAGEKELEALNLGVLRVLNGKEKVKVYK